MTSLVKNEVLSKRRSNQYVHSSTTLSKDDVKRHVEKRPASRIPRDQTKVLAERSKTSKAGCNKQKSKDIFKYTDSFDSDQPKIPSESKPLPRKDNSQKACSSKKEDLSNKSEDIGLDKPANQDDKIPAMKTKNENVVNTLSADITIIGEVTNACDDQQVNHDKSITNSDTPLNRSDQENIAIEQIETKPLEVKKSNKTSEQKQGLKTKTINASLNNESKSKQQSLLLKTNRDAKGIAKGISSPKGIAKAVSREKIQDDKTKDAVKQGKIIGSTAISRNSRSKSNTPSDECTDDYTKSKPKPKVSVTKRSTVGEIGNTKHPRMIRNVAIPVSSGNKKHIIKENVNSKTHKSISTEKNTAVALGAQAKLSEQALSKHNQQYRKERNKRSENEELTQSTSTCSMNSSFHSNVSSVMQEQMTSSETSQTSTKSKLKLKEENSRTYSKKKPPPVAETKTSVMRRSRSRSVTPGASSVSSESSHSNKSATGGSSSSNSNQCMKSPTSRAIPKLLTENGKAASLSNNTQVGKKTEKSKVPIKSYMRTTESMKNRQCQVNVTDSKSKPLNAEKMRVTKQISKPEIKQNEPEKYTIRVERTQSVEQNSKQDIKQNDNGKFNKLGENNKSSEKISKIKSQSNGVSKSSGAVETNLRETITNQNVTVKKQSDFPLNGASRIRQLRQGVTPLTSKNTQTCSGNLMTSRIRSSESKSSIKRPISKPSTSTRSDISVKRVNSSKQAGASSLEINNTNMKNSPQNTTRKSVSVHNSNLIANKSAGDPDASQIKLESCKNRPAEHKSKLIAPLTRNVSNRVSKVSNLNSRSLSNKSENLLRLKTDKNASAQKHLNSQIPKGRNVNVTHSMQENTGQCDWKQSNHEISRTSENIPCSEFSQNNKDFDDMQKLSDSGKISSSKEKQLLTKGNDKPVNGGHLVGNRELKIRENIIFFQETSSEYTDQCESGKLSEFPCFREYSTNSGDVQFMKCTRDSLTVMNDKNSVSMETVRAIAPECSISLENDRLSVSVVDRLSEGDRGGRSLNRVENMDDKTGSETDSFMVEQVSGNNSENNRDKGEIVGFVHRTTHSSTETYEVTCSDVKFMEINESDKCERKTISANQSSHNSDSKCVKNYETLDSFNENSDTSQSVILSDTPIQFRVKECDSNLSDKTCDNAFASAQTMSLMRDQIQNEVKNNVNIDDQCVEFQTDQLENDSADIIVASFGIKMDQLETKQLMDRNIEECANSRGSCIYSRICDDDRINSYILINTADDIRHHSNEDGCVSQQNDNRSDKNGYIKFCNTGAFSSQRTDKSQIESQIQTSESILWKDGNSDKTALDNSQNLSNQTEWEFLNKDKRMQDRLCTKETLLKVGPSGITGESDYSYLGLEKKELYEYDVTNSESVEDNENSCQAMCEIPEVGGNFTSIKTEKSDGQESAHLMGNEMLIPPEIQLCKLVNSEIYCRYNENISSCQHDGTFCYSEISKTLENGFVLSDKRFIQDTNDNVELSCESVTRSEKGMDSVSCVKNISQPSDGHSEYTDLTTPVESAELSPPLGYQEIENQSDCQYFEHSVKRSVGESSDLSHSSRKNSPNTGLDVCVPDNVNVLDGLKFCTNSNNTGEKTRDYTHEADNVCVSSFEKNPECDILNKKESAIEKDLCESHLRAQDSSTSSSVSQPAQYDNMNLNDIKITECTRSTDNKAQITQTSSNLCPVIENCSKHMQIVHCSNCFMENSEICYSDSEIKISESKNKYSVVKNANQRDLTACIPEEHGKFQKMEFDDKIYRLHQNEHQKCELISDNTGTMQSFLVENERTEFVNENELKDPKCKIKLNSSTCENELNCPASEFDFQNSVIENYFENCEGENEFENSVSGNELKNSVSDNGLQSSYNENEQDFISNETSVNKCEHEHHDCDNCKQSISEFSSPENNLCLCRNGIKLEHKTLNKCTFNEHKNKQSLSRSSSTEILPRLEDKDSAQGESTQENLEKSFPVELTQCSIITQMNINCNSTDQTETMIHSNMEELAFRSYECDTDRASPKSADSSARDLSSTSRDSCLTSLADSDNRWVLKSYNPNIHQDFHEDQMSGLSVTELTSQNSSYNQVFSEKFTVVRDLQGRISTDPNSGQSQVTVSTDLDKYTCSQDSRHISDINELKKSNYGILSECVCNSQTIVPDQSGDLIKRFNFIDKCTGNHSKTFDGKQPVNLDGVQQDTDYHFNKTQPFDVYRGRDSGEYPPSEVTQDLNSVSNLREKLYYDQTGLSLELNSNLTSDETFKNRTDWSVVNVDSKSQENLNKDQNGENRGYDEVDGQILDKFEQFSEYTAETQPECDLSPIDSHNTNFRSVSDGLFSDNLIKETKLVISEPDTHLFGHIVNDLIAGNLQDVSGDLASIGENGEHTDLISLSSHIPTTDHTNVSYAQENREVLFEDDFQKESTLPNRLLSQKKNKFIKSVSASNIRNNESKVQTGYSAIERSTETGHQQSLISSIDSNKVNLSVQTSNSQICDNAGEALCDNVSDITDIFDDSGDNFVDAEETLDSEIDTTDIDITNSSSCASDLYKQDDTQTVPEFNDINVTDVTTGITIDVANCNVNSGSNESSIYNCRESLTSTESFQDAYDSFVEGCSNVSNLAGDKTPENESNLSQISPHMFDPSQADVSNTESVSFNNQSSNENDDTLVQCTDDSMERRRRREISSITTIVTGSSAIKHVQAAEFRNSSAVKDNSYQCNTSSSELKGNQHIVQTTVLRSTDTLNESGQGVIENVIYKTGNSTSPIGSFSVTSTGENMTLSENFTDEISHESCTEIGRSNENGQTNQLCIFRNVEGTGRLSENSLPLKDFDTTSHLNTQCVIENACNSITEDVCNETAGVTDVTSYVTSSEKMGRKIETAVTIRTQRRRRRQIQKISTNTEHIVKSETDNNVNAYFSREIIDNGGINENSKIDSGNSSLIFTRSPSMTCDNEPASGFINFLENSTCSTLNDSSEVSRSIEIVQGSPECNSILLSEPKSSSLENQHTDVVLCDKTIVLTESENENWPNALKLESAQRVLIHDFNDDKNTESVTTIDTEIRQDSINSQDNSVNNFKSCLSSSSSQNKPEETSTLEAPTFTISVQALPISATDSNFDDIEFIDADDVPEVKREREEANDNAEQTESPNASFTVTFEIASDDDTSNIEIVCNNEKQPNYGEISAESANNENSVNIENQRDESDIYDKNEREKSDKCEVNSKSLHISEHFKVSEFSIPAFKSTNECFEEHSLDLQNKTDSNHVDSNEIENEATNNQIGRNFNTTNALEIQVKPLTDSYSSDIVSPSRNATEDGYYNSDDEDSVISEESNISVAHALKLEREKLNELNNNCGNNEELSRSRSRAPQGKRNIRSASTGNFALQLQKTEADSTEMLSNIKAGLSRRSIKKSSSFRIDRQNVYSPVDDGNADSLETMKSASKKVTDICRSFVQKARSSSRPRVEEEENLAKSPTPQRKLMKWVNDHGKWLRIPVNETLSDRSVETKQSSLRDSSRDEEDTLEQQAFPNANIQCLKKQPENANECAEVISAVETYSVRSVNSISESIKSNMKENEHDAKEVQSETEKGQGMDATDVKASESTKRPICLDNSLTAEKLPISETVRSAANISKPKPENEDNQSTIDTVQLEVGPSIVYSPTKTKPKLHLDIQKANEQSNNVGVDIARPSTAPLYLDQDRFDDEKPCVMNRSDFLLGIKDNFSRGKLVKMLSPTRNPQTSDFTKSSPVKDETKDEQLVSPKRIPKLTAVKIQEEIFEGKPEYMKQCNIDPLGIANESANDITLATIVENRKSRQIKDIKKSKTFASLEDAKSENEICFNISTDTFTKQLAQNDNEHRDSYAMTKSGVTSEDKIDASGEHEHKPAVKADKRKIKAPTVMRERSLQRPKLLSEIVEVEESKDEILQQTANNNNRSKQQQNEQQQQPSSKKERKLRKSGTGGSKRRSLSLPTGSLAFGDARIVYKNGHFTIETMDGYENDSSRPPDSDEDDLDSVDRMHVTADSSSRRREGVMIKGDSRESSQSHRPGLKRQCAKATLMQKDSDDSVFYTDPEERTEFNEQISESCSNSSHVSELSTDSHPSLDLDMENNFQDRQKSHQSSSSLPETGTSPMVKQEVLRARRTSSFRRAQQAGALNLQDVQEEQSLEIPKQKASSSSSSVEANQSSPSSQKAMPKRKSLNDNMNLFSKQSESAKDFFSKKMNLKGLFKKNKPDLGLTSGSPLKTQHPVSPPFAAFQGDDDIGSVDTPPGSPGPNQNFRRRHTSADLYIRSFAEASVSESGSNCPTPTQERHSRQTVSTPTTPSRESNSILHLTSNGSVCSVDEDRISVTSASSAASSSHSIQSPGMEQPHKPKTPKPVGASPRRSHSIGSHSSRTHSYSAHRDRSSTSVTSLESDNTCDYVSTDLTLDGVCECEHRMSRPRLRSDSKVLIDSSVQLCQFCGKCLEYSNSAGLTSGAYSDKLRKNSSGKQLSSEDNFSAKIRKDSSTRTSYEKLAIMTQAVMSSNSNDSGIQRDVSAHSSSESIKGPQDGQVKLRRKKSLSPHNERPKSEVGVRWADLDLGSSMEFNQPVRFRSRVQSFKDRPRPKSDLDGSSFLSERMKAFGSEINLQPYCSLRNLYDMRKQEFDKRKNRRMSTPHPIKSRLQRSPKKLQKQPPLLRSSSMPESLDKVTKRRKLHLLDFHMDSLQRHLDADDCFSDDSDLSFDHASLQERSLSIQSSQSQLTSMDEDEDNLIYAEALWDHITMVPDEIGFRAQDVIEVMDMRDKDWWYGAIDDKEGWFPAAFVRLRVNQDQIEEEEMEMTLQETLTSSPKSRRISMLNKNQARTNVVNEIINAEREYVKHLKDVVEGYIQHARKRSEMFPEERIALIFGNIETIYMFARKFLSSLETCIDVCPHLSEIGQCFLDNERGFEVYSDYCNNHPSACEELKELCQDSKYRHFFEACRLLQELVEIPLEGFLLTPVQKICKYPLQLAELLKYTPPDHPDYETVKDALSAMRKIATLINERKRKMESIEKIAAWQHTVADWDGEDLLEKSSELIFSGDINKVNTAGWSQERYFFLFDHQLIYCKKELLKRHVYSYKGRIDLDSCEVIDIPDGRDVSYNVTVKHAWKLHETQKDKWYLLYGKTQAIKQRWLKAMSDERKRVQEDKENDFCVPDHWKQTVLNKVRSQSSFKEICMG